MTCFQPRFAPHLLLLLALFPALPARGQLLSDFKDKHRVLLLFAPGVRDARYQQQLEQLARHLPELKERDLVIVPSLEYVGSDPATATALASLMQPLSPSEQATLRHRFKVHTGQFYVVLIGKDGGSKLESATPVPVTRLDRIIDAMPMRQDELRRQRPQS